MDRRQFLSMSLTVAAGTALTACGASADGSATGPQTSPPTSPTSAGGNAPPATPGATSPAPGAPAGSVAPASVPDSLQFTAPLVGGGTFDGAAFAGAPLALWFWAPT
jgi:hypothetical protein